MEGKRGRPKRHPTWKDGMETPKQEKMWPYASCVIAGDVIKTQNIGTLKAMARDKAMNKRQSVPVTLHLPDGTEKIIMFQPDGEQVSVD
ncbi:MAG: hypothetical protein IJ056_03250 [Acidaminococcaceae bacterium]|nr:hypothetical protein [Acidaminococcaceae bacterium]MBR1589457.1 hypothetical protein [Acidaminococcaceae bacterium]